MPLQEERILTWEQRLRNGRAGRLYRELDGVWTIDHESLCLFEIKFTFPENMERGVGIKQLRIAQDTLVCVGALSVHSSATGVYLGRTHCRAGRPARVWSRTTKMRNWA